jgi:hypothetical protein
MNDRAIELFKQAGEEAYKLCRENGHKVGDIDSIWVSMMAATLAELTLQEAIAVIRSNYVDRGTTEAVIAIEQHFGLEE